MNRKFTLGLVGLMSVFMASVGTYANLGSNMKRAPEDNYKIVYSEHFADKSSFDAFTVLDLNKDDKSWQFENDNTYGGVASILYSNVKLDDWLLTPNIALEAGKVYSVSFKAWGKGSWYKELMSVGLGKGEDVSTYKIVIPEMEYDYKPSMPSGNIIISETGNYHLGFHATSPANQYAILLDDIEVKEIANASAPKAASMVRASAAADGVLNVTLSFFSPSMSIDGKALTTLTKIEVYRDGDLIGTISAPSTGKSLTYTDTTPSDGMHNYSLVAYNENGAGLVAKTFAYVGEDIPGLVSGVKVKELTDKYSISWTAPTVGANGNYFNASNLKYNVYLYKGKGDTTLLKQNILDTKVDIPAISGEQTQGSFMITAVSKAGEGKKTASKTVVIGDPYNLPIIETFDNGKTKNLWWFVDDNDIYTTISTYSYCAYFSAMDSYGGDAYLCSGKINFQGSVKPTLSFKFSADKEADKVIVEAVKSNQDVVVLAGFDATNASPKWETEVVDLTPIKNENFVSIRFHAKVNGNSAVLIDDINIMDPTAKNLAASITVPELAFGGKSMTSTIYVRNYGSETATNYNVSLFADNQKVAEKNVTNNLTSMKIDTVSLSFNPSVNIDSIRMYAVVEYAGDEYLDDNTSDTVTVKVKRPHSKTVNDLTVENYTTSPKLQWSAPSIETQTLTEDFESYEPFYVAMDGIYLEPIYQVGEWTLTDKDQEYSIEIPNYTYPNEEEAFAYMVFNPSKMSKDSANVTDPSTLESIAPHSGLQYMASFSIKEDMAVFSNKSDDWLISPELTGDAQQVKFWVKSNNDDWGAQLFQVWYSTTDTNVANFIAFQQTAAAPSSWTEVIVDLPDGAKYFAVRCVSPKDNLGIFMVDDVTYTKGDGKILGYTIYRDGVKIAETDAETNSYVDQNVTEGAHRYHVTVKYNGGESGYSNEAAMSTAIDEINTETEDETVVERYNVYGQRVDANQKGIQIVKMANGKSKKIFIQ